MLIIDGGNADATSQPFHLRYPWQCLRCRCIFRPDAEDLEVTERYHPYPLRERAPKPTYDIYTCKCPTCEKDMQVTELASGESSIEFCITGRFIC